MSEYIDVYIDTTTKVPEDATEFDYELFERFISGGPWVAHSKYMELKAENAKLRELAVGMYGMLEMVDKMLGNHDACETPRPLIFGEDKSFKDVMRELGVDE